MDRIYREERLDRLAQCPMGHDTRHYYKWLDEIDELTKQNAKLLKALKAMLPYYEACAYSNQEEMILMDARQAIAEAEGQE